jgi:hypothetical protein
MSLLELFCIAMLATYRLTSMLHEEAGPADIFTNWRTSIGVRFDQYSNPYGTNWFAKGVLCFYCLSVWIAFGIAGWIVLFGLLGVPYLGIVCLFPFALSGGAVFLRKWAG